MSPTAQDLAEAAPEGNQNPEQTPETNPETAAETAAETDKLTSCLGCRKRKLKCSRDLPSCMHCQRLDVACVYDAKKAKPGLRPGAIEALSQRIEALENAFASRQATPAPEASPNVVGILTVLAQELQKLNTINTTAANMTAARATPAPPPPPPTNGVAVHSISIASQSLSSTTSSPVTANGHSHSHSHDHSQGPRRKRRRMVDSCGNPDIDLARPLEDMEANADADADTDLAMSPGLPPAETLQAIVNAYFVAVQPWIPVLHETQFRRRMHDAEQRPRLACILHAMMVAAARYVQPEDLEGEGGTDGLLRLAQRSRSHVLLSAMDRLSVESLQALIILAFHDIGSGETVRAWSIVGSLTRTVDYLGLKAEDENGSLIGSQPLLRPMTILGPPHNWIEEEERRRVFWCVLLLDSFCSVATGWNTGLAAADVHRRLPADGFFFHKEEPVLTPYMYGPPAGPPEPGAADRAREPVESPASTHSPAYRHAGNHTGNMTNVGAFAYCIEATESLSRVVSTFLRQSVDFGHRQDVSRWLTRFKELDLRLVHWKMYLPQRWRDSNVSRQPALVNMDPNLTLAHITHNTSTILLHQRIAYPDPAWWTHIVKLPSFCSAETCQNAAVETATITNKYLRYTDKHSPVASQFAFCVYISARVLLVHWRSEASTNSNAGPVGVDVLPEFWSLLRSMEDIDRRWMGSGSRMDQAKESTSLAGHYAQHLKDLHRQCLASPSFVVDVLGYTEFEPKTKTAAVQAAVQTAVPGPEPTHLAHLPQVHPTWPMQPIPPLDQLSPVMTTYQHAQAMADNGNPAYAAVSAVSIPTGRSGHTDDLAAISHLLLDQQFMDRDRVISFEDSLFAAPGRWT